MRCYYCGKFISLENAVSCEVNTNFFDDIDPPEREWVCKKCFWEDDAELSDGGTNHGDD